MKRCLTALSLCAAIWPAQAFAGDPPARAPTDCSKIADYPVMVACFRESARAANQAVEAAYQAFLRKLGNGPRHDLLVRSQASWLAYRDAYCALVSSAVEGGSAQPLIRNVCWLDVTNIRLRELEHQLTCQEGDLSCVVPHHPP